MSAEKPVPPKPPPGHGRPTPPVEQEWGSEWVSWTPAGGSYVDLTARLARADLQLCEMQAHVDELIEANLTLKVQMSEMTLRWVIEKTRP